MRLFLWGIIGAVLAFGIAGCAEGDGSVDTIVQEDDGLITIENRGTHTWETSEEASVQFTHEQTFGAADEPEDKMLAGIRDIAVDEEGVVYILDADNHRLVAFHSDGSLKWSAGSEGEGPGEFQYPYGMVFDGTDRLYVSNQMNQQIDVWDTEGTYHETISLGELEVRGGVAGFAEGHLLLSQAARGDTPQQIHFLDPDTHEIARSFAINKTLDLPNRAGFGVGITVHDGHLWVGHLDQYQISRYTLDGVHDRRITRPDKDDDLLGFGIHEVGEGFSMRVYGGFQNPIVLPSGRFLIGSSWPTNVEDADAHARRSAEGEADEAEFASALDVFTADGAFEGRLLFPEERTPEIGRPQLVGPDGNLYTISQTPFPQVQRYAIDETE